MEQQVTSMEAEERISIERRLGYLERTMASQDALLRRNTEILDEIRQYMNKPTNWAEWLVAAVSVLLLAGTLLYTAYIKPLEERVDYIKEEVIKNRNDILTITGYTKETKGVLNEYIVTQANSSNTADN
jgi:uncharacterized coiled-coil protein SlyX